MPTMIYGSSAYNMSDVNPSSASFQSDASNFPKVVYYPYPKPSRPNPIVHLWVANMRPETVRSTGRVDSVRLPVPSKFDSR